MLLECSLECCEFVFSDIACDSWEAFRFHAKNWATCCTIILVCICVNLERIVKAMNLSMMAWAWSPFVMKHVPLRNAISAAARRNISQFISIDLEVTFQYLTKASILDVGLISFLTMW
eukprot:gnl/MRDRNA2_/MRDRNA2_86126_c0_seq2.p2 gnl/MRDRNA2_/MRDRNA2_86126_c0~~gnl/MRDRNA2_/MRDRNA2_86126_c0_seq2.p2  ORF type:complete len:118 (+),score=8.84 gnl/MRDRNA2_/MRDRNA2_86126_c0_seq2:412-765(+)